MATFILVIEARNGACEKNKYLKTNFVQVLCIWYSITFQEKFVLALLYSRSEVNVPYPAFAKELDISIQPTNIGIKKINSTTLNINGIVVAAFLITDKANQIRFFKEIFLMVNISLKVVF